MSNKWHSYWMGHAQLASIMSKDPSTKCGAVIVRPDKTHCSQGYNGFPAGHSDDPDLYANREYKYANIKHAEDNAIEYAKGENMSGYTLYCWPLPTCARCAQRIADAGISKVVFPHLTGELATRWAASISEAMEVYQKHGVKVLFVEPVADSPQPSIFQLDWKPVETH